MRLGHRLALAMLVLIISSTAVAQSTNDGGTLTKDQRDAAVAHFQRTRDAFLKSIDGLTPEQWNFKPAPDRWSVAEVAEHITKSEGTIMGLVQDRIMKSPAAPENREKVKGKDEIVLKRIPDRSVKAQAPEILKPTGQWKTREELTQEFDKRRAASLAYIADTQDAVHDHFFEHPAAGLLDGYQWILLISAHSERHTAQIEEVKADPKFPKK